MPYNERTSNAGRPRRMDTSMRTETITLANAILNSRNGHYPKPGLAESIRKGTVSDRDLLHFVAQWAKWTKTTDTR